MNIKIKPVILKVFLFLLFFSFSYISHASDPGLARYTDDPSSVFWFIQITDLHIDNPIYSGEEDKLRWALTEGVNIVNPMFVVATGDLTDSTSDTFPYYGSGPHPEEWDKYRDIVDSAGMTSDFYYDIIGNHDAYNDNGASYYLSRSVQGQAQHTTQPDWRIDLPFGSYHFVAVATTCNDWLQWPFDNTEITLEELNELRSNLEANTDTHLTIAVGHHDYTEARGGGSIDDLFASFGVPYYIHGHVHDFAAKLSSEGVVIRRMDSLGQGDNNNFCVHAIDSDTISMGCTNAQTPWPLAVITAPVDALIGPNDNVSNPYAPSVPVTCTSAPIRVLVFDNSTIGAVSYWWSGTLVSGGLTPSAEIPNQWLGTFDATAFTPGTYTLNIEVIGSRTREFSAQIRFEDRSCDITTQPEEEENYEVTEETEEEIFEDNEDSQTTEIPVQEITDDEIPYQDSTTDIQVELTEQTEEEDLLGGNLSGGGCSCNIHP